MKRYEIVVIESASWFGRHEGKHVHFIGEVGVIDRLSIDGAWAYVFVRQDNDPGKQDVACYHGSNLWSTGLSLDKKTMMEIWKEHD